MTISTRASGRVATILRVASTPFSPGMLMSIRTTSGSRSSACCDRLVSRLGEADDLDPLVGGQHRAHGLGEETVIVCDQHSD